MRRVLIVNPISLYPTVAMNQVRTLHMAGSLKKYFEVEVVTPVANEDELNKSVAGFQKNGIKFHPLKSKKHKGNIIKKRTHQIWERVNYFLFGTDKAFIAGKQYEKELLRLAEKGSFDIIISNYWEISDFFRKLPKKTIKILDTHYSVKENLEVLEKNGYYDGNAALRKRELRKSLELETRIAEASDIILSLSTKGFNNFQKDFPAKKHLMIADGNDVSHYSKLENLPEGNTLVFYGSMSSAQNIGAFWRTYNHILPRIREQVPDVRLFVVGNKPPEDIKALHNDKDIIVTGFVEDVRPWLSKGKLLILPLEIGSGFRGRIVEVMAVGLPVVGTHNALDSLEMESGVQGLISDKDEDMADYCIRLLRDEDFRKKQSAECKKFVREKYSLEATFDKLTEYLNNYN